MIHSLVHSLYDWDWDSLENKDASPTVTNVTPAEEIRRYLLLHRSGEMILKRELTQWQVIIFNILRCNQSDGRALENM